MSPLSLVLLPVILIGLGTLYANIAAIRHADSINALEKRVLQLEEARK